MMLIDRGERGENNLFIHAKHFCKRADAKRYNNQNMVHDA